MDNTDSVSAILFEKERLIKCMYKLFYVTNKFDTVCQFPLSLLHIYTISSTQFSISCNKIIDQSPTVKNLLKIVLLVYKTKTCYGLKLLHTSYTYKVRL